MWPVSIETVPSCCSSCISLDSAPTGTTGRTTVWDFAGGLLAEISGTAIHAEQRAGSTARDAGRTHELHAVGRSHALGPELGRPRRRGRVRGSLPAPRVRDGSVGLAGSAGGRGSRSGGI